jgi:hypothetical protein
LAQAARALACQPKIEVTRVTDLAAGDTWLALLDDLNSKLRGIDRDKARQISSNLDLLGRWRLAIVKISLQFDRAS